jgi:hypothetical protein
MSIELRSDAFVHGDPIPAKYSQDGQNLSPPLRVSGVPDDARELVLIADDPDAPIPGEWVHWVMYKISPEVTELPEGIALTPWPERPDGAAQGRNTSGRLGYVGPAPPSGHGRHRYFFKIYAIDRETNMQPGAERDAVLGAIRDHVIDEGELVGTYER